MTKKGHQKFLCMKHTFLCGKVGNFFQTLKHSEKRGKSEKGGKCIIGLGGWTPQNKYIGRAKTRDNVLN